MIEFFPKEFRIRDVQAYTLETVGNNINNYDVFVLRLPVASGKSLISYTISKWAESLGKAASIIVPNHVLRDQYLDDFDLGSIQNKSSYNFPSQYNQAKYWLRKKSSVMTYTQYMANKSYNHTLCVDEAHMLVDWLREKEKVRIWGHLDGFVEGQFRTSEDILAHYAGKKLTPRLQKLMDKLNGDPTGFVLNEGKDTYRGNVQDFVELLPTTPRENKPIMWPRSVKKIFLMSATINEEDLYDLGLDDRRVLIIDTPSPIPAERRPIYYMPIGSMGVGSKSETFPAMMEWLKGALEYHTTKGLLHVTYDIAQKMQQHIRGKEGYDKLIFHNKENKQLVLNDWIQSKKPTVLVGCGMCEGVSLDGDKARWQAILKVPFPDLTDPAVAGKMNIRPKSYAWSAAKQLQQAAGRVCRTESDFGETIILDSAFERLYNDNPDLFADWFKEALCSIV